MRLLTILSLSIVFVCFQGLNQPAEAILIPYAENNNVLENAPHNCVGSSGNGSVTAVAPSYFMTAKHVYPSSVITLNGKQYSTAGSIRWMAPDELRYGTPRYIDLKLYKLGVDAHGQQQKFDSWCPINDAVPAALPNNDYIYNKYDELYLAGTGFQAGGPIPGQYGEGHFAVLRIRGLEMAKATWQFDFNTLREMASIYSYSPDYGKPPGGHAPYGPYWVEGNGNISHRDSGGGMLVLETGNPDAICEDGFFEVAAMIIKGSYIGSDANPVFYPHAQTIGVNMGSVYDWTLGIMDAEGDGDQIYMLPPHCVEQPETPDSCSHPAGLNGSSHQSISNDGCEQTNMHQDQGETAPEVEPEDPCGFAESGSGHFTLSLPGQPAIHLNTQDEQEAGAIRLLGQASESACEQDFRGHEAKP